MYNIQSRKGKRLRKGLLFNKNLKTNLVLFFEPKTIKRFSLIFLGAPVFLSYPHFLQADPALLNSVEGLKPDVEKHQTFFKIQNVSLRIFS